jgi:hypothetical protein
MILALLMLMGIWQPPLPPALGMAYNCIIIAHGDKLAAIKRGIFAAAETNCEGVIVEGGLP